MKFFLLSPLPQNKRKKKKGGSVQHQSGVVFCVPSNPWKALIISQSLMDTDKTEQEDCRGNLFLDYDPSVHLIKKGQTLRDKYCKYITAEYKGNWNISLFVTYL